MYKINEEKLFSTDVVVVDVVDQDHVKPIINLLYKKEYKQGNIFVSKSTNVILIDNDDKRFVLLNNLHFEVGGESKISGYSIYMSNQLVEQFSRYVKVINTGGTYTTYDKFFDEHPSIQHLKSKYNHSRCIEEGQVYKVLYEGEHAFSGCEVLVVAMGNDEVGLISDKECYVKDVVVENPTLFDKIVENLTTDQAKLIDYVDNVLERVEVVDITDDLFVKWRYMYCDDVETDSLEDFLEQIVVQEIEDEFYEVMELDWDGLDEEYKMLSLARKVMRELV
jgi:hypothetical protein